MQQEELPPHPLGFYELTTQDQADAVAWAIVTRNRADPPVKYPFKYPGLEDDEVRIQITYTGLCLSDSLHSRGNWGENTIPICPGHEVCGYVSRVGANVTNFKVGDRVGCNPQRDFCEKCKNCHAQKTNLCSDREYLYDPYFGGYCTHIQLKAKSVYKLPEGFKEELGSPLLCAGVTVYAPIKRYLKRNGTAAVIGIGGLGHLAVQYAAKLGMTVTAFTSTPEKKDDLHSLGATYTSSSIDHASLANNMGKYDLVINTLGVSDNQLLMAYQRLTIPNGTYIQVGAPDSQYKFQVDHTYVVGNQIRISGSNIGSYVDTQDMLEFSAKHNVYPLVETFKFEDFPKAFDRLENGKPRFRCVVNVIEWARANGFEK